MQTSVLSAAGLRLLDRRNFLTQAAGGLSGIALASLLAQEGLLAAEPGGWRPEIDPAAPLRARAPHFAPKAKRVLMIFCSGACSQIDTWDYKPELIKHDGRSMPGHENFVAFQGKLGNLTKSPWQFRPRGECGKMTSDLLPRLGELVDQMCFIHSMTSKTNTHGPGENVHEHRVHDRRVSERRGVDHLRARERGRRSARVCGDSRSPRRAAGRAAELGQRIPAGRVSRHRLQFAEADPESRPPAGDIESADARRLATISSCSTRSISSIIRATPS